MTKKVKQKLYRFEIDQSIRLEELAKDTIIALANAEQAFTLRIPSRVKRQLVERFRRYGQPKLFAPMVFAVAIVLIIVKSNFTVHDIVIDIEYPGYERNIIKYINNQLQNINVYFTSIGRKSAAHYAAYGVYIRTKKADTTATLADIETLLQLKNGLRTVTPLDKPDDSQPTLGHLLT